MLLIWHMLVSLIVAIFFFIPALLGIFVFRQRPVLLRHRVSGITKHAYLGWSWTYLYFGFLVPVIRGELLIAVLHAIISFLTFGLFQVIWSFLYNRQQMTRLLTDGWELADDEATNAYARSKLHIMQ